MADDEGSEEVVEVGEVMAQGAGGDVHGGGEGGEFQGKGAARGHEGLGVREDTLAGIALARG
jgi:hypothetical protein